MNFMSGLPVTEGGHGIFFSVVSGFVVTGFGNAEKRRVGNR